MSDDLVLRLSSDLRPVSRLAVARRLALGIGLGSAVSAALTAIILGWRPDMRQAAGEIMFWIKLTYTLALAAAAIWTCERLARPAEGARWRPAMLAAPVLAVAAFAVWQLVRAPEPMRMHMVMGGSAKVCPWLILAFSVPPLAGLIWAVRGLAPTRLRFTGLMIGLAAGGAGATAYALHCDESAAPFLSIWYTLGVAAAGALGGLLGPRVLRW